MYKLMVKSVISVRNETNSFLKFVRVLINSGRVVAMDVKLNGLSISAKKETQLLCCIMGKRCHFDVTFWLLMVGDWQASFSAIEQPYFADFLFF